MKWHPLNGYGMSLPNAVRWREDIPTGPYQDTVTLRAEKITAGGTVWYWLYTRRGGWELQGSFPEPPAIDQ